MCPALAGRFFTTEPLGKPNVKVTFQIILKDSFIVLTFPMMMQKQQCKEEKGRTVVLAQIKTVVPSKTAYSSFPCTFTQEVFDGNGKNY